MPAGPVDLVLSRRRLLGASALAAGVAVFGSSESSAGVAVPMGPEQATYLTATELSTLRALVDRVVPGPEEDTVPGAVAARCHEAIDALLGAFTVSPPRIYAGAPFSDRGGNPTNDFEDFLALDPYEQTAWELRVLGSRGNARLERNGAVPGYQRTYRDGLKALEASVPGGFSNAPAPARDLALRSEDPAIAALVDLAVPHTIEFMYGAPEYGGNADLVGWTTTDFEGDVQPRGFTDEQVTHPESSGPADLPEDLLGTRLPALGASEVVHGAVAGGDSLAALTAALAPLARPGGSSGSDLSRLDRLTEDLVARRTS